MLEFIGGMIFGVLLILTLLVHAEKRKTDVVKIVEKIAHTQKGNIYIPPSDEDEARQEKIKHNQEQGNITYLRDL